MVLSPTPKQKEIYAVGTGIYCGEMLAFMEEQDNNFVFLSIPKLLIRDIPKDKWDFAKSAQIIDLVEKLPHDVYCILRAEYQFKKENK